jgi:beta-galactosidase
MTPFQAGENHLRVVAGKGAVEVTDEIRFRYQTEKWDKPAKLAILETARQGNVVTVEVRLSDARGVLCLDARNAVRFAIAGDGELLQNLGTSTGSRQVELYNGRALIRVRMKQGQAAVSVSAEMLPAALVTIQG